MPAPQARTVPSPPKDELAPLLAELDDLTARAATLRARIAWLDPGVRPRPGWPIRRVALAPVPAASDPG